MITEIHWQGEIDGDLVLSGDGEKLVIDRPGDLVATMMSNSFASEALLTAAATYGFCLASRKVEEPLFVRQILRKMGPFLRSPAMESLPLYRSMENLWAFVEASDQEGLDLRRAVLDEVRRLDPQG